MRKLSGRSDQIKDFLGTTGYTDAVLQPMQADASFRRYIRIRKDGKTAILMDSPPDKENIQPYIAIAEYLYNKGYSAPAILERDAEAGLLLIEDLGDDSFTMMLKREGGMERELYAAAMDVLAEWHDKQRSFSNPQALELPRYDEALLMREISLFSDWYLPQVLGKDQAAALRHEYIAIWQKILAEAGLTTDVWVHRDYHADNLMWLPKREGTQRIGLLDFQDGVYGDPAYDIVSLLEDARRDVLPALAENMINRYVSASGVDRSLFLKSYAILGAQRNSKIVGIFSRLAARDNKFAYLQYLPRVWRHLERDLAHPALAPLKQWVDMHVAADQRGVISVRHTSQELALSA